MQKRIVFVLFSLFSSTLYGSTCEIDCHVGYTRIVDRVLRADVNQEELQDFAANCREYHGGHYGVEGGDLADYYLCKIFEREETRVSGWGSDIASARVSARNRCNDSAPSASHWIVRPYARVAGGYDCER